jgi:hypothetical protein
VVVVVEELIVVFAFARDPGIIITWAVSYDLEFGLQ